jgi:hypothetical protein
MRRFSDRMASVGATVLDLMTSEISRLSAISSLHTPSLVQLRYGSGWGSAYRLLLVAFSTCSSRAVLAEFDHQLIMLTAAMGSLASQGRRNKGRSETEMRR